MECKTLSVDIKSHEQASGPVEPPRLLRTLISRLGGKEQVDLEYKKATNKFPSSAWATISAFANTKGGWLVLGATFAKDDLVFTGIEDADKMLQVFFDQLRNPEKISFPVCGADDALIQSLGEKGEQVILIRVPAASRAHRPVYIGNNPYTGTYLRRHGGDYHCLKQEVNRTMREASEVAADSSTLPDYGWADLDRDTFAGYRRRYQNRAPASAWNGYDDQDFLRKIGGFEHDRETGEEALTVAGLLMFGTREALRRWRGRHLIEFQLSPDRSDVTGLRWEDRIAWEGNLLGAFEAIYPPLTRGQPIPFRLEGGTRLDEGPVHVALREALVNLLVHADYAESQSSFIVRTREGYTFQNPGSSRVPAEDLLIGRSDPRNPRLMQMFRYIGLSEEAGSGIPNVFQAWRQLGFHLPSINVGTEENRFILILRHSHLISDEDRLWLSLMGDTWDEPQQLALVRARHRGTVNNAELSQMSGLHPADVTKIFRGLCSRNLLDKDGSGPKTTYRLASTAQNAAQAAETAWRRSQGTDLSQQGRDFGAEVSTFSNQVSTFDSQVSTPDEPSDDAPDDQKMAEIRDKGTGLLDPTLWRQLQGVAAPARKGRLRPKQRDAIIVELCTRAPLSRPQLAELLGRDESYLWRLLRELVNVGRLRFLYPDQPNHPLQKYVVGSIKADSGQ